MTVKTSLLLVDITLKGGGEINILKLNLKCTMANTQPHITKKIKST